MIEKIKKLFALARDKGATEAEARSAMEKASKLMLEHNIKESDLENKEEVKVHGDITKEKGDWMYQLAAAAAVLYSCEPLLAQNLRGDGDNYIVFVGRPENTAAAKATFDWLIEQAEEIYKQSLPKGFSKARRAQFRRDFKWGLALRVYSMALEIVESNKQVGKALMVIDQQIVEAKEYMERELGTQVIKARPKMPTGDTINGHLQGERVKLNERTK